MPREFAAAFFALAGALAVVAALVFFCRPRLLLQWLRGTLALALGVAGVYSLAIAMTLFEYDSLEGMETVARLSVYRKDDQFWQLTLEVQGESPRQLLVHGDQWQLDARIMRFAGPLRWLGVAPGYRLERLSGRYSSLEQERSRPRTVIALYRESSWFPDLWLLDRKYNLPFVEAVYGNATFMPMRDSAAYEVRLSSSGLLAVPLNEPAREAVEHWGGS